MHVEVPRVPHEMLRTNSNKKEEASAKIRKRVISAREIALSRCGKTNNLLSVQEIQQFCQPGEQGNDLLEQVMDKFGLSHRAYHRILKLSRTIADLSGSNNIEISHLSEAIGYRVLDRK